MNIEKYIIEHREKFDSELPSPNLWKEVELALDSSPSKKGGINNYWVFAISSLLILLILSSIAWQQVKPKDNIQQRLFNDKQYAEIQELNEYYNYKYTHAVGLFENETASYVNKDLSEVDKHIDEIINELENSPIENQQEALEALHESYLIKIKILDKVLRQNENHKKLKNSDHEKKLTI